MRTIKLVLGIITGFFSIFMLYNFPVMISGESGINTIMIESTADRFFLTCMILGCAAAYGAISSASIMSSLNILKGITKNVVRATFIVSCFVFIAGAYYHMIFGSPL